MPIKNSLFQTIYNSPYGCVNHNHQLFDSTKNSKSFLQRLCLQEKIKAHNGCVNSICWNESGKYLLSGSDDQHLCLTQAYSYSVVNTFNTGHRSNIFCAKFLPGGDNKIISCSGDGVIIYSDLNNPESCMSHKFNCHFGTAYEVMTVPNEPSTFLSCGEDGTVRWFDLRTKTTCMKENCKEDVLINCHCAVTGLSVNGVSPYQLAVGCADASVRIYDRRMLGTSATGGFKFKSGIQALMAKFTVPHFTSTHRITSLDYSKDGKEVLVSYSSEYIYLFDVKCSFDTDPKVLNKDKASSQPEQDSKMRCCFPPVCCGGKKNILSSRPMMKRLRVRGDWSDTGPQARPESEARQGQEPRSLHASLMQRMSDALTTMYNQRTRQHNSAASSSSSSSEDRDANAAEEQDGEGEERPPASDPSVPMQDSIVDLSNQSRNEDAALNRDADPSVDLDSELSHSVTAARLGDLDITMVPLPSLSTQDLSASEGNTPSDSAINMSLENIKNEMSKRTAPAAEESTSVIKNNSSEPVFETVSESDSTCHLKSATSIAQTEISDVNIEEQTQESPESICDTQPPMDSTSSQIEENCDVPETSLESSESTQTITTQSLSSSSSSLIPQIFVAPLPPSDEATITGVRRFSSNAGRRLTVMMELDTSWRGEQGEAQPSLEGVQHSDEVEPIQLTHAVIDTTENNMEEEEDKFEGEEDDESGLLHCMQNPKIINSYKGHRNARTMIKEATFWGDNYIMSGSDCGHIFIWDRFTTELVMLLEADHHVVNCLQPHPFDPILASSGIDYDIKIWAPLREDPFFDEEKATELITRNKVMLEETRDTITVPASFMIRMLASLNHVTSGSGWRRMAQHLRDGSHRNR